MGKPNTLSQNRRNAVLEASKLFDVNKPFRIAELIELCDLGDYDKTQVKKNLSIWTNEDFSNAENDRIRKVIHRVKAMGTGWYVKVSDKIPRAINNGAPTFERAPETKTFTAESYPKPMKKGGLVKDDALNPSAFDAIFPNAKKEPKMVFEGRREIKRYYIFGIRIWEVIKFTR